MLNEFLFARNRIPHEVDQVGYLFATAKGHDGFAASSTRHRSRRVRVTTKATDAVTTRQ